MTILKQIHHRLSTDITDDPRLIAQRLGLDSDHLTARHDPLRGWQIVVLHQGRTLYIDCEEKAQLVIISK